MIYQTSSTISACKHDHKLRDITSLSDISSESEHANRSQQQDLSSYSSMQAQSKTARHIDHIVDVSSESDACESRIEKCYEVINCEIIDRLSEHLVRTSVYFHM